MRSFLRTQFCFAISEALDEGAGRFLFDNLIALVEARHPELASLRKDVDAQSHEIEVARRQHLPTVSL